MAVESLVVTGQSLRLSYLMELRKKRRSQERGVAPAVEVRLARLVVSS